MFDFLAGRPEYVKVLETSRDALHSFNQGRFDACADSIRSAAEWASKIICDKRGIVPTDKDGKPSRAQSRRIWAMWNNGLIDDSQRRTLNYLRELGNQATHDAKLTITRDEAKMALDYLKDFLEHAAGVTDEAKPKMPQPASYVKMKPAPALKKRSETPAPAQSSLRTFSREENIKWIEDAPAIPLLLDEGVAPIDIYSMDSVRLNELRLKIETKLKNGNPQTATISRKPAEASRPFWVQKAIQDSNRWRSQNDMEVQAAFRHLSTGKNDPCPCGSGKKYKHCCGKAQ
ncbi:MAG: SEC-C domain-containing protein [Clostridiales bacterium]|nr:SEC-C domain-containing protein [Clostridiales bacterium]